jgi:hypothetical protein
VQPAVVFSAGGTVQASGGIYITRPADDELFRLCIDGEYANVLTSRQMGKSSLRVAVSDRLRREGIRIASIDLTSIGTQADSAEQWYVSFLETVEAHRQLTPTDRFSRYLLDVALAEVAGRVVVFVDEIDSTLSLPFGADDFFAAIRAMFNARAERPEASRLSFVFIGSVAPGDLIRDSSRTPFNIGRDVALTDFSEESVRPLAAGFGIAAEDRGHLMHRIFEWTAGHPYLTQRLAMAAAQELEAAQADFEGLVRRTFLTSGNKKDSNLEWVRDMLTERAPDREAVLTTWRDVLRRRRVLDEEASLAKSHLKLTGVVRAVSGRLEPRNRIYREAFDEVWAARHLPLELERQRRLKKYRRLAYIAAAVALMLAGVGSAMGILASRARQAQEVATLQRDNARTAEARAVSEQKLTESALREAQEQRSAAQEAARERASASLPRKPNICGFGLMN